MDLANPLPHFRGQLDAVLFHGLAGPPTTNAGEGARYAPALCPGC